MTSRTKKDPHVVIRPPGTLLCLRCGASYEMALPAPVELVSAMGSAFDKTHRRCKETARGVACELCFGFGHASDRCPSLAYGGDPDAWWRGPDTGLSSKTIWLVMRGRNPVTALGRAYLPADPADFGRCHRLLAAFAPWRDRLDEMRPFGWSALVDHWAELESLYIKERPTGSAPKLFARMLELEKTR